MARMKYKPHSSFCMKLGLEECWMRSCQAAVLPNSRFTRSRADLVFPGHGHKQTHNTQSADTASHWQSNTYRRAMSLQALLGHGHQKWPGAALMHLIIRLQAW